MSETLVKLAQRLHVKYAREDELVEENDTPTVPGLKTPPNLQAEITRKNIVMNLDRTLDGLTSLEQLYQDYNMPEPFMHFAHVKHTLTRLREHVVTTQLKPITE
jgi:hypothetical protein